MIFDLAEIEWKSTSACANVNPDIFFPIGTNSLAEEQIKIALEICEICKVKNRCLENALKTKSENGIWGALTEDKRKKIVRDFEKENPIKSTRAVSSKERVDNGYYENIVEYIK